MVYDNQCFLIQMREETDICRAWYVICSNDGMYLTAQDSIEKVTDRFRRLIEQYGGYGKLERAVRKVNTPFNEDDSNRMRKEREYYLSVYAEQEGTYNKYLDNLFDSIKIEPKGFVKKKFFRRRAMLTQ